MSLPRVQEIIIVGFLLLITTQLSYQHLGPPVQNTRKISQGNNSLVTNKGRNPDAINYGGGASHNQRNKQPANTTRATAVLAAMLLSTQPSAVAVSETYKTQQKQTKPEKPRKKLWTKRMPQQRETVAATATATVPTTQATATQAKTPLGSKLQVTPAQAELALPKSSSKLENSAVFQLLTSRNLTKQLVQKHYRNEAHNDFLNRSISDDVLIKMKPGFSNRTHALLANISRKPQFKTSVNTAEKPDPNILAKNGTQHLPDITNNHQQTFNMSLFKVPQKQRGNITGKQKIKVKVFKQNWLPFFRKPKVRSVNEKTLDMELSLSAMLIEHHLIAVWTVATADTLDFQGFRVLCLHAEYDDGEVAMEKAEHISPILGPALRSYTPADLIVDGHYTVCLEVILNATHVLKRQCRSIVPHKPSVVVGILAGCIFLVPCIIFVFYILVKDRSIQKEALLAHAHVAPGSQLAIEDKWSPAMLSVSEESCCSSCSAESDSCCQFNQKAAANSMPQKSSLDKPTFATVLCSAQNCRAIHATHVATTTQGLPTDYETEIRSQEDENEFSQIKQPLLSQKMQQQSINESSKLVARDFTGNKTGDSNLDLNALLTQLHDHPQSVSELRESIL